MLHPQFYSSWFPFLEKEKVLMTGDFLKREGFKTTIERINSKKIKNIVIIAGSHSGFSTAWILLNGPATQNKNNSRNVNWAKMGDAVFKSNQNCSECCTCAEAKKKKEPKCGCLCKCLGYFTYRDWEFDYETLPKFDEASIKILYRDKIRVFYGTVRQAENAGYKEFSETVFSKKNGYVYSYTGLRGDSKRLYTEIVAGREKRVKLIKAPNVEDQVKYVKDADLVFWACGYQSNKIPIKDFEGKEITLS